MNQINDMNKLAEMLPFIIPILVIEMGLALFALIHVLKHPNYRFGNKIMWIIIVLCIQMFGPIFYLLVGRGEE